MLMANTGGGKAIIHCRSYHIQEIPKEKHNDREEKSVRRMLSVFLKCKNLISFLLTL